MAAAPQPFLAPHGVLPALPQGAAGRWTRQCRRWAALVLLALGAALPARAGDGSVPPDEARAWLARLQSAAATASYQGTLVLSSEGVMRSTRVWHFGVDGQSFERRESMDGRVATLLRHNDTVHTYWPHSAAVRVERGNPLALHSGRPVVAEPRALEHYLLRREGSGRVAGRVADVFLLAPRDGLRYAQRLWSDRASGLLLRADVLGPDMSVLESAAFSAIEIGVRPQPEGVLREMRRLEQGQGVRVLQPQRQRTDLQAEGWTLARTVAGFALAGCVRRPDPMSAEGPEPAAPASPDAPAAVLQAVFFDGLTHVSVFIEPFRPQRHREALSGRLGATSTLMVRRDQDWITAVGDVPPGTLQLFVDALQRRR